MNLKYFLPAAMLLLLGTACQKLKEDPKASLTPGTYFKNQSDLDASVAAIYTELTPDYAFPDTTRMTSCFGADDLTTDPGLNKGDMRAFDELFGQSNNQSLLNQWQGPWNAIYQANNACAKQHNRCLLPSRPCSNLPARLISYGRSRIIAPD